MVFADKIREVWKSWKNLPASYNTDIKISFKLINKQYDEKR